MPLWTPDEKLNYIYAFIKYDNAGLELDFWQDDFIRNRSRFICLLKSRQTGFSFVVALKGLVKALDPARRKYTRQFVSYNEEVPASRQACLGGLQAWQGRKSDTRASSTRQYRSASRKG